MRREHQPDILIAGCAGLNIQLSDRQLNQFVRYYELLIEKNKVMNLTAITEWNEVQTKHYLDSLLVVKTIDLEKYSGNECRMLDLGTGAGFPGIPLKIAFPQLQITLADSLQKRISFLEEVISDLGLEGIQTVHERAEIMGRDEKYREQYDLVVSRAVAALPVLSELMLPLVKLNGYALAYKSTDIDMEYHAGKKAIRILGGHCDEPDTLQVPGTDLTRSFVKIHKIKQTPHLYPRKAGTPKKSPLI